MPNEPRYESFITRFDLRAQKTGKVGAVFVAPPSLCARVTVAAERATVIYSPGSSEPLAKLPGDQLALETHWRRRGDELLQTAKEVL